MATDNELEALLQGWQAQQRGGASMGLSRVPGAQSIDLNALRGYLANEGTTASNLAGKLQVLQSAADPRLSTSARALLADPKALSRLQQLYRSQDLRYWDDRVNESVAQSEVARAVLGDTPATPYPESPREVGEQGLEAVDELQGQYDATISDLIGLRDAADPYDVTSTMGRGNFDRILGAQKNQELLAALGYDRPIQADASARGMLQAGTTGAKMAAAEGALDAALVNREAALGADFLNRSAAWDQGLTNAITGAQLSTAPIDRRLGVLQDIRGQYNLDANRDFQQTQANDARSSAGWGSVAEGLGTIGGAILAGPVGGVVGKEAGKVVSSLFGGDKPQAPAAPKPVAPPYQSDTPPRPTYGLSSAEGQTAASLFGGQEGYNGKMATGTPSTSMQPNAAQPTMRFPKRGKAAWA